MFLQELVSKARKKRKQHKFSQNRTLSKEQDN